MIRAVIPFWPNCETARNVPRINLIQAVINFLSTAQMVSSNCKIVSTSFFKLSQFAQLYISLKDMLFKMDLFNVTIIFYCFLNYQ